MRLTLYVLLLGLFLSACQSAKVDERRILSPSPQKTPPATYQSTPLPPIETLTTQGGVQDFEIQAPFGRLAMTRANYGRQGQGPLIVMCMGATENRYRSNFYYIQRAVHEGDVITFDYPGYGQSGGQATTENFDMTASVMAEYIESEKRRTGRPVIVWGHSLGGFVCSEIARRSPAVDGVIIETSAQNVDRVVKKGLPLLARPLAGAFIDDNMRGYDIARSLRGYKGPVLVMGAEKDLVLDVELSQELANALSTQGNQIRYVEFANVGHTNLFKGKGFRELISGFMRQFGP